MKNGTNYLNNWLDRNQKAITSGLEDIVIYNQLEDRPSEKAQLAIYYKPAMLKPKQETHRSKIDKDFDEDEMKYLMAKGLYAPSEVIRLKVL